jgi:hypothetical protein
MTWLDSHNLVGIVLVVLATALVAIGKLTGAEWVTLVSTIYVATNTVPAKMAMPVGRSSD